MEPVIGFSRRTLVLIFSRTSPFMVTLVTQCGSFVLSIIDAGRDLP
jgi:pseudouridine-5'-phosphate glycosidase